jgi:hypothetical protein
LRLAPEHRAAVGTDPLDATVVTGVELRRQHQLHQRGIALLLRQRQRQRLGVVAVLHVELGLQRVACGDQRGDHAADQRQHHHQQHQQTHASDQRHGCPPCSKR